jgi:hypothetical protein
VLEPVEEVGVTVLEFIISRFSPGPAALTFALPPPPPSLGKNLSWLKQPHNKYYSIWLGRHILLLLKFFEQYFWPNNF